MDVHPGDRTEPGDPTLQASARHLVITAIAFAALSWLTACSSSTAADEHATHATASWSPTGTTVADGANLLIHVSEPAKTMSVELRTPEGVVLQSIGSVWTSIDMGTGTVTVKDENGVSAGTISVPITLTAPEGFAAGQVLATIELNGGPATTVALDLVR